jgi:hypothetical protein
VKFLEKDMFGFYSYGFIHGYTALWQKFLQFLMRGF